MLRKLLPPLLAFLALASSGAAQRIEDDGPHPVGWRTVTFTDGNFGQGFIRGVVYYPAQYAGENAPADPGSGPFDLVAHMHGWFGAALDYHKLQTHTASWGFVVASIDTEKGFFATQEQEARDTQALLQWVEDESNDPLSWLAGMVAGGAQWGASGHSMGGGACMYLIGLEPRVTTLVPLQPYRGIGLGGSSGGWYNLQFYTGAMLIVCGEVDTTVPFSMCYPYHGRAALARRNFFYLVYGMGHLGPVNDPPTNEPLPAADQLRLHKRFVTGFYRAEMRGEEDLYVELLGEGLAPEPVDVQSTSADPPLWARVSTVNAANLVVGSACARDQFLQLAWSSATGSTTTPWGTLSIDLGQGATFYGGILSLFAVTEVELPIQAGWSGTTLYLQGGCGNASSGTLTRMVPVAVP